VAVVAEERSRTAARAGGVLRALLAGELLRIQPGLVDELRLVPLDAAVDLRDDDLGPPDRDRPGLVDAHPPRAELLIGWGVRQRAARLLRQPREVLPRSLVSGIVRPARRLREIVAWLRRPGGARVVRADGGDAEDAEASEQVRGKKTHVCAAKIPRKVVPYRALARLSRVSAEAGIST